MNIIDSHVHAGISGLCNVRTNFEYDLTNDYKSFVKIMDMAKVDQAVILPIPHRDFPANEANLYLIEASLAFPGYFFPFCRIDNHLKRNLNDGFYGAKIHLLYEDIAIKNIKEELHIIEDANVPLIVHFLFNEKVRQVEEILKIAPNINLILAHMGRGHIYTSEHVIDNAMRLRKYDNVYFETSTTGDINAIIEVCNILGTERVIFGSDFPFGKIWFESEGKKGHYQYRDEVDFFIHSSMKANCLSQIMAENILDLLMLSKAKGKVTIRRAYSDDYNEICALLNIANSIDEKYLALSKKLALIKDCVKKGRHCYVAMINGGIVGFMRESGRPDGYSMLEEVFVHPEYRNKGVAKKLLVHYHRMFKKSMVKTNAKNEGMIYLLKKTGYTALNIDAPRIINWERVVNTDGRIK